MIKWLVTLGLVLLVSGLLWPWLARMGLGRLPGDVRIERKGRVFQFPITSSLLLSALLTLVFWLT
ncbi:MAG TPA: DUF2905 domain-containing protein [Thiobacillaceae bacterium]|nr:DUF2905 domain-containing protein [Thiobacillaceae bacterium]